MNGAALQRRRLALLAILARAPETTASRDRVVALLWPEHETGQARRVLSESLYVLRRELGAEAIHGVGDDLRLNTAAVAVDVVGFERALAAGDLERAVALYRGPFLDGFHVSEAPEFERWLDAERASLARQVAGAMERLASAAEAGGDLPAAVQWWRRRAAGEPTSSRVALELMRLLAVSGDPEAALRHARVHEAIVRDELGAPPDPRVLRLAEEIRAGTAAGAGAERPGAPPSAAAVRPVPVSNPSAAGDAPPREPAGSPSPLPISPAPLAAAAAAPDSGVGAPVVRARRSRAWRALVGTAGAGAVLAAALALGRGPRPARPGEPDPRRVLVAAFTNESGDSTLDGLGPMVADWITQGLSRTELINVVDPATAFQAAREAGRDGTDPADRLHVLAQRTRAGTVLWGSYYLVRDSVVFQGRVTDARDGTVLRVIPPIGAARGDPMPAAAQLRERATGALATVLDPRLASLSSRDTRPPLATAYLAYLSGLDLFVRNRYADALPRFVEAAKLDTTFMLPVLWAAYAAHWNGRQALGDSFMAVLAAHENDLAPLDRYALEHFRLSRAEAPADQILAVLHRAAALAPGSEWSFMEGRALLAVGRVQEALVALRRVDPEHGWASAWPPYWKQLGLAEYEAGEYRAALETARRAERLGPQGNGMAILRSMIALGEVDSALARLDATLPLLPPLEAGRLLSNVAVLLLAQGYRAQAAVVFQQSLARLRALAPSGDLPVLRAYANTAFEAGLLEEARRVAAGIVSGASYRRWVAPSAQQRANAVHANTMLARAILGAVAAARGDRATAEAEIRAIEALIPPDAALGRECQAAITGALHDRTRTLAYLAKMQSGGGRADPLILVVRGSWTLRWLEHDPALRDLR